MRLFPAVVLFLTGCLLAGAARADSADPGLPSSVRIKPLMLPILDTRGRVQRYTQLEVTLELADAARLPEYQVALPKLQDAVLSVLYAGIEAGWIVQGSVVNANLLRRKLTETAEAIVAKDTVDRVLITPVARQSAWP